LGEVGSHPIVQAKAIMHDSKNKSGCSDLNGTYTRANETLAKAKIDADLLVKRANLISSMQAILELTNDATLRIQGVSKGDYSEIEVYRYNRSDNLGVGELANQLARIDLIESLQEVEVLTGQMDAKRKAILRLIQKQDIAIRKIFEEAAAASEWNRKLGYLKMAATAYRVYHYIDTNFSSSDNAREQFIDSTNKLKEKIENNLGRTPASEPVLDLISEILGQAKLWGGLINTRNQLNKMDAARKKIAYSLGDGLSKQYHIVVLGTEFLYYEDVSIGSVRPGGAKTAGTVTIEGVIEL
jgi:hypothetical protein